MPITHKQSKKAVQPKANTARTKSAAARAKLPLGKWHFRVKDQDWRDSFEKSMAMMNAALREGFERGFVWAGWPDRVTETVMTEIQDELYERAVQERKKKLAIEIPDAMVLKAAVEYRKNQKARGY